MPHLGWLTQNIAATWKSNSQDSANIKRMAIFAVNNIYPNGALAGDISDDEAYELRPASHHGLMSTQCHMAGLLKAAVQRAAISPGHDPDYGMGLASVLSKVEVNPFIGYRMASNQPHDPIVVLRLQQVRQALGKVIEQEGT